MQTSLSRYESLSSIITLNVLYVMHSRPLASPHMPVISTRIPRQHVVTLRMNLQRRDTPRLHVEWKVSYVLDTIRCRSPRFIDSIVLKLPVASLRGWFGHVTKRTADFEINVVDNEEDARRCGDDEFLQVARQISPREKRDVNERFTFNLVAVVTEFVDFPRPHCVIERRGYQHVGHWIVVYIFHPVLVADERFHFRLQVPDVPDGDRVVVRAGRKHPRVEKRDAVDAVAVRVVHTRHTAMYTRVEHLHSTVLTHRNEVFIVR